MEELIEQLKTKHSELFRLDIPTSNGDKVLILRKLDRVTYSAGMKIMEKDELQAAEVFLRSLTVGGDNVEEIIKDFDALRTASQLLVDVIGVKKGNVARL